jgi:hypothetical protein
MIIVPMELFLLKNTTGAIVDVPQIERGGRKQRKWQDSEDLVADNTSATTATRDATAAIAPGDHLTAAAAMALPGNNTMVVVASTSSTETTTSVVESSLLPKTNNKNMNIKAESSSPVVLSTVVPRNQRPIGPSKRFGNHEFRQDDWRGNEW